MKLLLATSTTTEGITHLVNSYFFSSAYVLKDDGPNKWYIGSPTVERLPNVAVELKDKRYRFYAESETLNPWKKT